MLSVVHWQLVYDVWTHLSIILRAKAVCIDSCSHAMVAVYNIYVRIGCSSIILLIHWTDRVEDLISISKWWPRQLVGTPVQATTVYSTGVEGILDGTSGAEPTSQCKFWSMVLSTSPALIRLHGSRFSTSRSLRFGKEGVLPSLLDLSLGHTRAYLKESESRIFLSAMCWVCGPNSKKDDQVIEQRGDLSSRGLGRSVPYSH